MKRITHILCISFLTFMACDNANEADSTEPIIIEPIIPVNYSINVKLIIDNNCISCHSNPPVNGAQNALTTYNAVKNGVNNNNLIARISAQAGDTGAMPSGGPRLPQNLIDLIALWQADGLLEN